MKDKTAKQLAVTLAAEQPTQIQPAAVVSEPTSNAVGTPVSDSPPGPTATDYPPGPTARNYPPGPSATDFPPGPSKQ